jgi:hypothetical protein
MAVATWCEIGASLILAGVSTVVALALIGFSLSLVVAVALLTHCASLTPVLTQFR